MSQLEGDAAVQLLNLHITWGALLPAEDSPSGTSVLHAFRSNSSSTACFSSRNCRVTRISSAYPRPESWQWRHFREWHKMAGASHAISDRQALSRLQGPVFLMSKMQRQPSSPVLNKYSLGCIQPSLCPKTAESNVIRLLELPVLCRGLIPCDPDPGDRSRVCLTVLTSQLTHRRHGLVLHVVPSQGKGVAAQGARHVWPRPGLEQGAEK